MAKLELEKLIQFLVKNGQIMQIILKILDILNMILLKII